jgi:molybdopterin synthase sulfur carrier subunit
MVKVLYFARLSEALGISSEEMEINEDSNSIDSLVTLLRARGEPFDSAFCGETKVLVAINQEMTDYQAIIKDGDEVAFFPPVTGG